ncbi:MAG TPA: CarD family transcriptional regulator, partial [Candidatus Dormibacteraeota bacterium]
MPDTLLDLIDRLPAKSSLEAWWNAPPASLTAHALPVSALPVFAAWLARRARRPVLALVADPEATFSEAGAWFGDAVATTVFPAVETLPFDRLAPDEETVRRRLEALDKLASGEPVVCFSSWTAMTRPTLGAEVLARWVLTLKQGERYQLEDLLHRLAMLGYRREPLVQARGEFSLRGGILDIFPPDRRRPVRAEFFGDEAESLREFEVETQGSVYNLPALRLLPAAEVLLTPEALAMAEKNLGELDFSKCLAEVRDDWQGDIERLRTGAYFDGIEGFQSYLEPAQPTLLDHLPAQALLLSFDARRNLAQAKQREEELKELVRVEVDRGELPGSLRTGLVPVSTLQQTSAAWRSLELEHSDSAASIDLGFEPVDAYAGRFDGLAERLRTDSRAKQRILIVSQQEARLRELLEDRDIFAAGGLLAWSQTPLMPGLIVLGSQPVAQGFRLSAAALDVYGDTDIFGGLRQRVRRGVVRARSATWKLEFEPGDLIVHVDHGIGRFLGMRLMGEPGEEREYMQLEYADGDKLYVPVEHLERVQKYVAGGDATPRLQRLGSGEWDRAKRKVRESVEEVAKDLLDLYSKRELVEGHAYSEDGPWQHELEQSFPYDETPDQVRVMAEIKADMEDARPMDRLLAGDVGFGKTELAVRAAFKAVTDSKQVAVLVPTTVLAQQHFLTFSERFRPFPVKVDMLSRFRSESETKDVLR